MTNQVNQEFEKWLTKIDQEYDEVFDAGELAQLSWQAATQDSESEINSLKQRVEELEQENEGLKVQSNRLANGFVSIIEMDNVDFRVMAIAISLTTAYDFDCLAQHDNEVIDRCKNIVADDALAITFQSMGAYRSAIIKQIGELKATP